MSTKDKITIGFIVIAVLGVIVAVRMLWAKIVYHDSRCAWAECRITVNPQ